MHEIPTAKLLKILISQGVEIAWVDQIPWELKKGLISPGTLNKFLKFQFFEMKIALKKNMPNNYPGIHYILIYFSNIFYFFKLLFKEGMPCV